jgi:hypothetical protein
LGIVKNLKINNVRTNWTLNIITRVRIYKPVKHHHQPVEKFEPSALD